MTTNEYDCPLCEFESGTSTELYTHIMRGHRKSTITKALLEASDIPLELTH